MDDNVSPYIPKQLILILLLRSNLLWFKYDFRQLSTNNLRHSSKEEENTAEASLFFHEDKSRLLRKLTEDAANEIAQKESSQDVSKMMKRMLDQDEGDGECWTRYVAINSKVTLSLT